MKKLNLLIILILCLLIGAGPANAVIKKLAQTGLQFLKVDMSARAAAMGGSYIMVGYDASGMFYNPAGLAKMQKKYDVFASMTQWIADIKYTAAGAAVNLGNWGTVGVSFVTSDYGDDIIGTMVATSVKGFVETGNLTTSAYAIGLSYARSLTDKFSIGGQIKYCHQQLGSNILTAGGSKVDNVVNGLAYDIGTIFYPGLKSLRFGMAVRNYSPTFKYRQEAFQLPMNFIIGTAMDILDVMGEHKNPLILSFDYHHPRDFTERMHVGAEYTLFDILSLRAGYKFNYDEESVTAGVGVQKEFSGLKVNLGYAYGSFGEFDMVNRIEVGLSF